MISLIIGPGNKSEFETDSPQKAGKEVTARLKGMKDAIVRIVVEPRKSGKEKDETTN